MKEFFQPIPSKELQDLLLGLANTDNFVFLETTRGDEENHRSFLFTKPVARLTFSYGDQVENFFSDIQVWQSRGYYLAGWMSYEFGHLLEPSLADPGDTSGQMLADFGVYRAPAVYDHSEGAWDKQPEGTGQAGKPSVGLNKWRIAKWRFSQSRDEYLVRVDRIKDYIAAGDTYQVNYTLKLFFDFEGSTAALYETLRRNQSVSYGAFMKSGVRRVLSFSPELFFRKRGEYCLARPMKGTSRRAASPDEDRLVRDSLAADPKNRSENVMIVDLLRNDLGRLCRMGTVKTSTLFDIETYETLHQMTSTIEGRLRPDVSLAELFKAIFPCGSVTGAPKIRTMQIIKELEAEPRGIYTGAIGFISPVGDAVFNVPIRTVVLEGERGEMGIGSGIVADSDPENEWDECNLKARFLTAPEEDFQLLETILWQPPKGFWLLEYHLERLAGSAEYWGVPCRREILLDKLDAVVRETVAETGDANLRIRLLLHKDGSVETMAEVWESPTQPIDAVSCGGEARWYVALATEPVDRTELFLRHKTTRRGLYEERRSQVQAKGCFEALLINRQGELTEGSFTNLFVHMGRELLTPPLSCGLLNGVLRQALLAGDLPLPDGLVIREEILHYSDLQKARAIYVGNSVRGLVKVELVNPD